MKATKTGYADSGYTYGTSTCAVTLTCSASANLTVPATSTGFVMPTWYASGTSGVTYVLQYSTDGREQTTSYTGTGLAATITMPANGTYTFRVKATKTGYADSGYTYGKNTCAVILTCSAPMSLTVPATNTTESFYVRWGSEQHKRRYL